MSSDQLDTDQLDDEALEPLKLDVSFESPSACERHVTVTISREDIDRYYDDAFSKLMPSATVPGFRAGRAPRKLVESRFRKDMKEQVKGSLLMDSMEQISEDQSFTAISEPDFDPDAVEIPEDGPMTFEFNLEVRPEFDLPEWRGMSIERPTKDFGKKDVDKRLEQILAKHGTLVPHDGKAKAGDYVTVNITCRHDDEEVASAKEEVVRIRPVLSFHDGRLEKFDKLMKGVAAGETREAEVELTADAANEELRGKKVQVELEALEIKRLELPELTPEFLEEMGSFDSEEALRDAIENDLKRQLEYRQHQQVRQQITKALIASADWELPPSLLERQSARELERAVLELRRSGFGDAEIRAHENELRQNSAATTATALKEHFILERIAEDENIDVEAEDYDKEISLIALQSGESPRRVRAQLEKRGMMDVLRNQIIERRVIDLVREHAKFEDVPLEESEEPVEAIDLAAGGGDDESLIPDVEQAGDPQQAVGGGQRLDHRSGSSPSKPQQSRGSGPTGLPKREAY